MVSELPYTHNFHKVLGWSYLFVNHSVFDDSIPSLSVEACNTPAFLCPVGIYRMARDFNISEKQYEVNVNYLKESGNLLTNLDLLEAAKEDIDKRGFRL